jgi:hypothetical protein
MDLNSYFSDFPRLDGGNAHLDVIFKDGKFLDFETRKEIKLEYDGKRHKDGILVKLVVPLFALDAISKIDHLQKRKIVLLEIGTILYFGVDNLSFFCELEQDLYLNQIGNHIAKLSTCKCKVIGAEDSKGKTLSPFSSKSYDSLNQAYTGTSIHFFPKRRYHTGNVFKKFSLKDFTRLEYLRDTISWESPTDKK